MPHRANPYNINDCLLSDFKIESIVYNNFLANFVHFKWHSVRAISFSVCSNEESYLIKIRERILPTNRLRMAPEFREVDLYLFYVKLDNLLLSLH